MKSKIVVHPGEYVKEELDARGWSQRDLAYILGCPEQAITAIIKGKRGITSDMAKALGVAFDVSPALFANLQQAYDLAKAKEPDPSISLRREIQSKYPAREMIKRGWLTETKDPYLLEAQLAEFFGVQSLDEIPHISHAARKTFYDRLPPKQLVWLFRVKNLAKKMQVPKFSENSLINILPDLHDLMSLPENIQKIPNLLANVGVRLVLVEGLTGSKVDGVCCWLDKHSPVIGLSIRYDRIDHFWFTLRHEIEHILRKDGQDEEIIDEDIGKMSDDVKKNIPARESAANKAASDFIIPPTEWKQFSKTHKPMFSRSTLEAFAKTLNIHPGLVVGQLQGRGLVPFSHFKKYLVKIRDFIVRSSMVVDGWGLFPSNS
jgi:HTH-type transcriptional regulator/antitoxin HigA